MVRILQMIGSLGVGGSQTMIMNLYRNINRDQVQFDFIIDHPEYMYFEKEIKALGGKIYTMPTFQGKNVVGVRRAWGRFFEEHKEYRVLHSHVRSYAFLYLPIAKKYGLKTIVHSHSTSNGSGWIALVKSLLQYPLRYQSDYYFGCSKKAGIWLFGEKIVSSRRYYMLKNAIDIKRYVFSQEIRKQYRLALQADENTTIYIHVGRLHISKNHVFLLDVFSELVKGKEKSLLVLVGDGELKEMIKKRIHQLGISKKVVMLGNRNDVPELLQAADCFVFPSKWEGLPVSVVEAQAAGLPCFVSDTVTREVCISSLVQYFRIDQGTDVWVDAMRELRLNRKDVLDDVARAGFDIKESACWLADFYMDLVEKM